MAKAPRAGEVKTRLCPPLSPVQAAELAEAFLLDVIEAVRSLEMATPVIAYAPADARALFEALAPDFALVLQRGADLGERLAHVFDDLLATSAQAAIVIGSDAPTLPRAILDAGVDRIGRADLVLGPSEDGGYYLIGLREPRPELFADIAWSTGTVFEATTARARARGLRTAILPIWFDVDTGRDLERLGASLAAAGSAAPHTRRVLAACRSGAARS
jgi:rSAM/selenodomain-associated transferase 1